MAGVKIGDMCPGNWHLVKIEVSIEKTKKPQRNFIFVSNFDLICDQKDILKWSV